MDKQKAKRSSMKHLSDPKVSHKRIDYSQKSSHIELRNVSQVEKETCSNIKRSIVSAVLSLREEESNYDLKESLIHESKRHESPAVEMYGVRIRPAVLRFDNAFENQRYMEKVSVQNISENIVTVRIYNPRAWSFRLDPLERGHRLAPGLKITRCIHFTCTKCGVLNSSVPIYINDDIIEIPLEASKGQAFVEIVPTTIQFGRVDIGCKPVERKIRIKNVSFCATKFLVDLGNNEMGLHVGPLKGWIRPNSSVTIFLKLLALKEGIQSSELWITTDLCQTRVYVEVEAWSRRLVVLHPNTITEFTLVDFPMTFYGCRRYQTLVVYNMAATTSAFVVLADYGSKGQEPFGDAKKRAQQYVKMFDIEPTDGKIRPFEKKIFTFWFVPKMTLPNELSYNSTNLNDYLCTVRIKRIQVDDSGLNRALNEPIDSLTSSNLLVDSPSIHNLSELGEEEEEEWSTSSSLLQEISVLLYLYGEAEIPSLCVIPDALYFPNTPVGTTVVKVVQFTNKTNHTLALKFNKIPFFEVFPDFKKLGSKTSFDCTVKLHARNIGILTKNLIFDILAKENATDDTNNHVVNQVTVKIVGSIKPQKVHPQPKFNPGITPMITHEVGFLTDEVTFASNVAKPRCAMTVAAKLGRPWHQTDATIAFPNDRPLTLRPRPTDTTAKTIYKGLPRYIVPVDESQTYTPKKLAMKKSNGDSFLEYLQRAVTLSGSKECCLKWEKYNEPDPPIVIEDEEKNLPREIFVPLTLVQLYRIRIYPALMNFGSVTTRKSCSQILTISNDNDFKISAKLMPLTSGVSVQTLEHFIVSGKSETKVMLTFQRERLGRYNGTISCIINGFHSVDVAVVAEVVYRSLTITPEYLEIKIPDIPFADLCVPVAINNPLNIPITFSWIVPEESPIKIEPIVGVAPKLGTVLCGVFFEPENPNYKLHPLKLMVEGSVCIKLKTGVVLPKTNVYFVEPVLNVGNLPMNLTTVRQFMVFNPDFSDAMFVVLNKEPIKGVQVSPSSGSIKAKSCLSLFLHIKVPVEKVLDFIVYMNLQNSVTIEMKVTGNVVFPEVELTPKRINLHRVPCNSVIRTSLTAENKSKAQVEVSFNMEEYPQFKLSYSKRYHDPGLTSNDGITLESGSAQKFYLHFIPKDLASYEFYLPVLINGLHSFNSSSKESEARERTTKAINRVVKKSSSIQSKKKIMSHLVLVNVVVLKECLVFSNLKISFSAVLEENNFSILNTSEQPVYVIIRSEDIQGIFHLFVNKGNSVIGDRGSIKSTVEPGEYITYNVTFVATTPGLYVGDLNIITSLDDHSCVYNAVRVTGHIALPCVITPSVKEIYFEPVPLSVEVSSFFHLNITHNQKNEKTLISFDMTGSHSNLIAIEYPEGNVVVGVTSCDLIVKITFKSVYPVSFREQLTFKGGELAECIVMITATADSCLLTTHAFLKAHSTVQPTHKGKDCGAEMVNVVVDGGKYIPPKQHLMKQSKPASKANDSTSEGSGQQSLGSIKTNDSDTQTTSKKKQSLTKSLKRSTVIVEKDRTHLSKSDIDLSLQLNEKEEMSPPKEESAVITEVITMEEEKIYFPLFPPELAVSETAAYMKQTLNAVEVWVYEQVFCCSYSPQFGSHSFSSFSVVNKKDYSLITPVALKNVFDVLERICGRRVRRYFTPIDKIPEDKVSKAFFTHSLYQQLVEFMKAQGALMAHVEPKYLMVYGDYCHYHKSMSLNNKSLEYSNTEIHIGNGDAYSELMSAEKFHSISVQCWLDLFLQMFKVLILGPAVGVTYNNLQEDLRTLSLHQSLLHQDESKKTIYGRAEEQLLSWLTHHYNIQRTIVWPNESPPPRTVMNFDVDLEDGLVLTATTAAYCPYLNDIFFHDMCLNPSSISQAYHNTTCLCMAWGNIKLGFSITPRDFVQSNTIKMLLLVTHLYKILPSYKPEATIAFKAILNASEFQIVTLDNDEEVSISYHVQILPNTSNFYLENCQGLFVLKRKSKGQITVQYMARNTNKAEAILLVCGACMPPKFGRNYVFKLEGHPIKLPVSSSFNILSPVYTPLDTEITIESPHTLDFKAKESYSYELWVTYTEPQPGNINAVSWAKERTRKIPRRLFFSANTLVVTLSKTKTGSGILAFKVCCYSQLIRDFWLIFKNSDNGDFIVKLEVTPRRPDPVMCLQVTMNKGLRCSCSAGQSLMCNRSTAVKIPCRNLEQWSAVTTMFELTISPEEKGFWATYIESNIGFRLLQWMLAEKKELLNSELDELFKKSKTYKVSCPSKYVTFAPTIHIPDVRCKSLQHFVLHLDETTPSHSTFLVLTSADGFEMRCYNLKIEINDPDLLSKK